MSETLFEKFCSIRNIDCARIPVSTKKTADFEVLLGGTNLIVEVKQLEPNSKDKELAEVWGTADSPGAIAPSDRVQGLLEEAYPQIRASSEGKHPAMVVVYNNSGDWNWIDTFTVAKAMFGSFGIVVGLRSDTTLSVVGHGYLGNRKVTKDTFRSLSVVAVLKQSGANKIELDCYHNPFAHIPIEPVLLSKVADAQYIHSTPHERGFVSWEPKKIEI